MPETDIDSAIATDLSGSVEDYSVPDETLDSPDMKEFRWRMDNWNKYLGYYKKIPELKTAIDTKSNWVIGQGFTTDPETELLLGTIKGHGKDSFIDILKNLWKVSKVGGDSFAEIVRNEDGLLINLKPLAPDSMEVVFNKKGRITRYEQWDRNAGKMVVKFKPEEIFHLSNERLGDEVHGTSVIPAVETIILMRNEAMADWKRVLHRNVDPLFIFHLDTDDATEIATFKTKHDNARKNGENLYIPKGVVEPELVATAANASLNPLNWINQLNDYFFQAVNTPQIIIGNAKEFTDASGKIVYLSFEQSVKGDQKYVEDQILNQLNVEVELEFPATLQNDAISNQPDTETEEQPVEEAAEPNDQQAETEGPK